MLSCDCWNQVSFFVGLLASAAYSAGSNAHEDVQSHMTKAQQHCLLQNEQPMLSAAVQNKLALAFRHCKHTCQDLLLIRVCSLTTIKHNNTVILA